MAKTKTKTQTAGGGMAQYSPRAQMIIARSAPVAKKVGGAVKAAAISEKHTIAAVVTAGALGYMDKNGQLDNLQVIDALPPIATVGIGLWIAGRFTKSPMLQHAATGALSIAVYNGVRNS